MKTLILAIFALSNIACQVTNPDALRYSLDYMQRDQQHRDNMINQMNMRNQAPRVIYYQAPAKLPQYVNPHANNPYGNYNY